jgi:cytochrome b561
MLENTRERWGSLSKAFHWSIAGLIVLEVPAGYLMSYTYGLAYRDKGAALPLHNLFSQIHHTNGFLILLLVTARLAWRLHRPRPAPVPEHFPFQHILSYATHALLYVLLFLLPFSGWAALSVYGVAPIWLFNQKGLVPSILPVQPWTAPFGYSFYAHVHVYALYAGAVLLCFHLVAALWHQLVVKDDAFARIWPLGRVQTAEPPPV